MKSGLRIKNTLLVVAIASAYPLQAHAAAGVAQFTSGDVTLRRGAGTDTLTKGKNIESGDAIVTGPNGRAQVRFTDGGLVALAPNSQFNITRYADAQNAKDDSFLVDLLRGGMRAVTGLIGKRNRDNYKVTTQTATIGIRGSAFNLAYNPDGTLSVSTEMDEIEVCTKAGCVGLTAGESARVTSNDALAVRTNARTSIVTPPPRQLPEVASNQVTNDGKAAIVTGQAAPPPPPPPKEEPKGPKVLTGLSFAYSGMYTMPPTEYEQALYAEGCTTGCFETGGASGAMVTDADGKADKFQSTSNDTLQRDGAVTIVHESGSLEAGDLMVLGTWDKAKVTVQSDGSYTYDYAPFAFVAGVPTSSQSLAMMSGMRGEYSLAHATDVFVSNGTRGVLLPTSHLSVDFTGAASATVGVYLDVSIPNGPTGSAGTYNMSGDMSAQDGKFSGYLYCDSDCQGYAEGFFSGESAKKVGLSYSGRSYYADESWGGAAIFERSSVTLLTPYDPGYYFNAAFAYDGASSPFETANYGTFTGKGLVEMYPMEAASASTRAFDGTPHRNPGDDDFIGWGYWTSGSKYGTGTVGHVHYIVAKPATYMPTSGTGTYTMIGHTTPTSSNGGAGSLLSASLTANFGVGTIDASVATRFGTTDVNINVTGATISDSRFSGSSGSGAISGLFTGYEASHAGYVYTTSHGTLGTVSGAAAFKQTALTGLSY
jgi:hypothetical protein